MTTATLYRVIQSELYKKGFNNEIVDDEGNLVFFDSDHQIMPKILQYDEDVESIINELFGGLKLFDDASDYHFKRNFMYRFIDRQINRQTIEAFKFQLMSTFLTSENYINRVYTDLEKYLEQQTLNDQTNSELTNQINQQINQQLQKQNDSRQNEENTTQNTTQEDSQNSTQSVDDDSTTDSRTATARLPQNNVQIDVNNTVMDAADSNEISRNKSTSNQNTTGETSSTSTGETTGNNTGTSSGEATTDTSGQTDTTTDSTREGTTNITSKAYKLDELFKTNGLLENIYNVFDVKCFLQTW